MTLTHFEKDFNKLVDPHVDVLEACRKQILAWFVLLLVQGELGILEDLQLNTSVEVFEILRAARLRLEASNGENLKAIKMPVKNKPRQDERSSNHP